MAALKVGGSIGRNPSDPHSFVEQQRRPENES